MHAHNPPPEFEACGGILLNSPSARQTDVLHTDSQGFGFCRRSI
jgi:hypothetical protein